MKKPTTSVEAPQDVSEALKRAGVDRYFAGLPPSHRREHLKWILEAKKTETRKARIEKAMKMLVKKSGEGHKQRAQT